MELVRKKDKRGQFVRQLSLTEKVALLHVFSTGRKSSQVDIRLAKNILDEMDRQELWVKCDCIDQSLNEDGPYNCEVNVNKFRHVSTSSLHSEQCPLFRLKKDKDADNTAAEGKTSPLNPVGGNDWLPDKKKDTNISRIEGPAVDRKRRRKTLKPIPALGRKLLTLIQAAGLNQLELVPEYQSPGLVGSINKIKDVLEEHSMSNGTPLSQLCSCAPWQPIDRITDMLSQLEVSQAVDNAEKEACVYIIGIATDANREEVTFSVRGNTFIHRPEARVSINGESTYNAGSRAPYWAILEYRRGRDGKVYCHEGYAHAAYTLDNPVPVDSNKERDTLKVIINASSYAGRQPNHPDAISLSKPLFTSKSMKNGVEEIIHPDFILNVVPSKENTVTTFIIETMGSESEEYVERKRRTHSWMEQEGVLLTDPPGWPEPTDRTFNSYLLRNIFSGGKMNR
ncbi:MULTISPECIES: hypothetical protein [Enterobacteriaceae]|jgi:hypothetical protein|uniref:Uncharacterized protein n=1 Tax=Leclercia adecarboxylata TaxID=83655 RepID=A0A6H0A3M1_9ENTR|nr:MULTISPECIES: hypothetical protein [Enterobacteriaceae]UNJ80240.1 ORF1 [Leclercia sp.]MCW4706093.1 hypothetical protein [Enterobacter kobei]QIS34329.1 hypothetical protein [Leclercia adecarboxylata]QLG00622.1 ORF1 [Leclercia adecarboxylata]HCM9111325.1 hypothetical protein [Enterobacter kobei]